MKTALIGATGFIGTAILNELISRKHTVVAIARNTDKIEKNENVKAVAADVNNKDEVAKAVKGMEAVISAYNAGWTNPNLYNDFLSGAQAIQTGVKMSGVKRLIVIGGAGGLYGGGVQLVDSPQFPEEYKAGAQSARDYLNILKTEKNLDWTFLSPAIEMHPGLERKRTGKYRTGLDNPVFDDEGKSTISVDDLAVAIVDELENNKHSKERFTVAY